MVHSLGPFERPLQEVEREKDMRGAKEGSPVINREKVIADVKKPKRSIVFCLKLKSFFTPKAKPSIVDGRSAATSVREDLRQRVLRKSLQTTNPVPGSERLNPFDPMSTAPFAKELKEWMAAVKFCHTGESVRPGKISYPIPKDQKDLWVQLLTKELDAADGILRTVKEGKDMIKNEILEKFVSYFCYGKTYETPKDRNPSNGQKL